MLYYMNDIDALVSAFAECALGFAILFGSLTLAERASRS